MSYAMSAALQAALYQALTGDPDLSALIGGAIYDALPAGSLPETYVVLGAETVEDRSDQSGGGAQHDVTISVISAEPGFHTAKTVAVIISDGLVDAPLVLSRGRLIALTFVRAEARREDTGALRRIDLVFRARLSDET